jgi:hypothetical protein
MYLLETINYTGSFLHHLQCEITGSLPCLETTRETPKLQGVKYITLLPDAMTIYIYQNVEIPDSPAHTVRFAIGIVSGWKEGFDFDGLRQNGIL